MTTPPFVKVGNAHEEWAKIGANEWIIRQIRFGLQLPWTSEPGFQFVSEYDLGPRDLEFARKEVARWLRMGYVRRATDSQKNFLLRRGRVSPAFVSTTARKPRLVVDYSKVNDSREERTFRMDQLGDLAAVLVPKDSLFKADISDAYYHLRLRKSDQGRLAFRIAKNVYVPLCLNCGLSVAPWFFTKLMKSVVSYLQSRGHRIYSYLDDFFGAARRGEAHVPATPDATSDLGDEICTLFRKLGLTLYPQKCDFREQTRLEILGIVVDTELAMFALSPEKLFKIETQARRLLSYARDHRRFARVRDIRRFSGLGNSVSQAVVDARLRLRELFNSMCATQPVKNIEKTNSLDSLKDMKGSVRISHAAIRDLRWWAGLSKNKHVGRAVWPQVDAQLFTDASMSGWGAAWNGIVPASGFFTEQHEGSHINELELLAALYGLKNFVRYAKRRAVEIITDSMVTEHIVRNLTSRSPRLLRRLRESEAFANCTASLSPPGTSHRS